jgi:opacity protein-like surface antigen
MSVRSPRTVFFPGLVLITVVTAAAPAAAEWFADVYLGAAVTHSADVAVTTSGRTTTQDVQYGSSVNPGVRVGRWADGRPWLGVAVDASYFGPQSDIQVIPISALVMARLALLKSEDFPQGRLHPYLAGGPGLFISHIDGTLGTLSGVSDTSVDVGIDVRVGVAWRLETNLALFTEYRFTHVSPTFNVDGSGTTRTAETTFDTHHIVIGASFRF